MPKPFILVICVAAAFGGMSAHADAKQQPPEPTKLPIWPGTTAGAKPLAATTAETTQPGRRLIAGKPYLEVHNVSRPTMTIYSPKGKNTGAFGLRRTTFPITRWPQLVETWLKTIGMIAE